MKKSKEKKRVKRRNSSGRVKEYDNIIKALKKLRRIRL